MVLEKPLSKKLAKIEVLKIESNHLIHPLKEVSANRFVRRSLPHIPRCCEVSYLFRSDEHYSFPV
jgi:hypothetical protein